MITQFQKDSACVYVRFYKMTRHIIEFNRGGNQSNSRYTTRTRCCSQDGDSVKLERRLSNNTSRCLCVTEEETYRLKCKKQLCVHLLHCGVFVTEFEMEK